MREGDLIKKQQGGADQINAALMQLSDATDKKRAMRVNRFSARFDGMPSLQAA